MARLLSGRVKVTSPTGVSTDRYSYLKLEEAEPNAGVPDVSGYVLASDSDGGRFWRSAPGASAINGITIKEDGSVVGTAASVNSIDFVSSNLTATASGAGSTITFNDSPTFTDLTVSGLSSTAQLNVTGVGTITTLNSTNIDVTDLNAVTGGIENDECTNLTVTGIATISGLKYPTADGSANQVVATDGAGTLTLKTLSDLEAFNWETTEQDFGLITASVTQSPDNGLITDDVANSYTLGFIVVSGLIYPDQFVLPSFTVSTLPQVNPAGQMLLVTDETGGSVPAFSDGTNWRRVTDRAIVS